MHDQAGGIALFAGAVRDHDHGESVSALSYEAHHPAEAELRRVAEEVAGNSPARGVAPVPRVGHRAVGDLAVVVAVSGPHRGDAFDACRMLIDELKATVPIWKHQRLRGGSGEWGGCPA